jgi:Winged helix DNA-binding domain
VTHRIKVSERRARLAVRHHVAPKERVASVVNAARDLVCFHATDPATVYLSAWARTIRPTIEALDHALYRDRLLIRMLAMRRTMFVVPVEEVSVFHAAAATAIARTERKRNEALAAMLGVRHPAAWLRKAETAALATLERRGEATAQELAADVPALQRKVRLNVGKRYEGDIGMSSRVLLLLGLEGKVVRGRPRGTWISSQYRWAPVHRWLGHPLPAVPESEAQAEVIRRWLSRFGPGTEMDIRWWTGWTARVVRSALATIGAVEVDLDGARGFVLPDDLEPTPKPKPWVALLPALDPTTMGWQAREWYLGGHVNALFDRNGNAGPTIWVDGRIVGGWAVRKTGEVVTKLLEDVGRAASLTVTAEAARLTSWLGAGPTVARFPTPLAQELVRS